METGTLLTMCSLNTDISLWHPLTPDAAVCHYDQCNGHPTICVSSRLQVGLLPIIREVAGYTFKHSLQLHTKEFSQRYDEWGEIAMLTEAILRVLSIFLLF